MFEKEFTGGRPKAYWDFFLYGGSTMGILWIACNFEIYAKPRDCWILAITVWTFWKFCIVEYGLAASFTPDGGVKIRRKRVAGRQTWVGHKRDILQVVFQALPKVDLDWGAENQALIEIRSLGKVRMIGWSEATTQAFAREVGVTCRVENVERLSNGLSWGELKKKLREPDKYKP
jgi:hypothetical protein